jgi:drug/metabolite transporter (DMT)-like permease
MDKLKITIQPQPSRTTAVVLAFLVTIVWATSWVMIKIGLKEVPPLTFVSLRYSLAFIFLLFLSLRKKNRIALRAISTSNWALLVLLGVFNIFITQGALFFGLSLLPAVSVSLLMNLTPLLVTIFSNLFLKELPTWLQWFGVGLTTCGILIYFLPVVFEKNQVAGVLIILVALISSTISSILGRKINREETLFPLTVTAVSIGIGSCLLLFSDIVFQGFAPISWHGWIIILILALVNTALAFTVWNYCLQTLTAIEASMINSTMLIFVGIFSWIFTREALDIKEIVGMVIAVCGVFLVQLRGKIINPKNGI